jgi:tRNA 2-thiouridine synthesizing protein D
MANKTLSICLMDAPYETTSSTTAFRIMDAALRKGHSVNVFAYEGAVSLSMKGQKPHPNPARGTSEEEEKHTLTKEWVEELFSMAKSNGAHIDWVNCGLCVDERGAEDWVEGPRRGSPGDFLQHVEASNTTLVIPTKRNS